jgi:predicted Zn-dependent protease
VRLTRSEQTNYRALAGLVQVYIIQKQYDRALEVVTAERPTRRCRITGPSSWRRTVVIWTKLWGSPDSVAKLPDSPELRDTLGWIYTKRKMNDSAVQVLDKVVREHPDVPAFRYHLATALYQKGDAAKARAHFRPGPTK